ADHLVVGLEKFPVNKKNALTWPREAGQRFFWYHLRNLSPSHQEYLLFTFPMAGLYEHQHSVPSKHQHSF
ncbi:hypothetical protein, partial [Lacticaseibacillus rhamnosus]|uniref:hypothetical protein n=1 Tax=Lacticaseibacillus rhamnosus TaxID=47715 RepID=UPI000B28F5ED